MFVTPSSHRIQLVLWEQFKTLHSMFETSNASSALCCASTTKMANLLWCWSLVGVFYICHSTYTHTHDRPDKSRSALAEARLKKSILRNIFPELSQQRGRFRVKWWWWWRRFLWWQWYRWRGDICQTDLKRHCATAAQTEAINLLAARWRKVSGNQPRWSPRTETSPSTSGQRWTRDAHPAEGEAPHHQPQADEVPWTGDGRAVHIRAAQDPHSDERTATTSATARPRRLHAITRHEKHRS